ncbi:RAB11-binding protein RELCH homolog [Bacillus rossius redtenbacheri]|uniref:RAB11-binding protein RELCH homolog n=1 Tax=Bacillus rossius redtenbacheri TaxID=93214 RepID=UPI002FDE17EC
MADILDDANSKSERNMKISSANVSYNDIAQKLLSDNLLLTALELHTELVEAGREVPKLREFFSNPGNFEQALIRPEITSIPRSSSQVTLDSLDLTRYSEDGERGIDERVAVLEFELRKAKETISALRAHLTVATESEATTPDAGSFKQCQSEGIKPHEQRALNFLINEYLLLHGYKLTSITFADENEDQDFEDWDDVGLNIPKPLELLTLYREFMRHVQVPCCSVGVQTDEELDKIEMENQIWELRREAGEAREQLAGLELNRRQLEERLRAAGAGKAPASTPSSSPPFPERFELIEAEAKSSEEGLPEDTENSRTEDDGSAVVSLADTDVGWTRVNHSQNGVVENQSSPPSSSAENIPEMLSSTVLFSSPPARILPAAFQKEVLLRCFVNTARSQETPLLEDILNDGISEERLVYILGRSLPRIIPNVILNKREELLPLIISTIHLHPEASERDLLLNLLFNLKKRPQEDERRVILSGIVCIAQCSGPSLVENEILPQCWEQINHKHTERRLLVAESCCALAPFVSSSIRNSLMLSMLQQMLLEDKEESVREVVVRSLSFLVAFMDDPDKYVQCEELALMALDDPSPGVVSSATRVLLPVLAKWAQELSTLHSSLLTNLLLRLEKQSSAADAVPPSPSAGRGGGLDVDQRLAWTLTALQTLVPCLVVSAAAVPPVAARVSPATVPADVGEAFEPVSGLTNPSVFYEGECPVDVLLGAFDACMEEGVDWPEIAWVSDTLIPKMLDVLKAVQVGNELVVTTFIKFFRHLSAGFGKTFLKKRLKPVFVHRLQELEKALSESRNSWPSLTIIPVYIVGILAVRRDAEACEEVGCLLKRFVSALPVCGAPPGCLEATVRGLCEVAALQDAALSALWDAVVHPRAPVRAAAASLFATAVAGLPEALVSSRVAPALVTLASDPDISVRTATIPAFGSLITSTTVKEVQDKTYMQLQSFLADPATRDDHAMLVQLVVTMGRIVSSCETWFREEVVLPQLAAMSAYALQLSNQTRRLDLAVALIEAFSSAVCCSLSKQTVSTVLLPGLRYLEPISSQSLLAHHDTVVAMIKGAESRVETHHTSDRSGSLGLSLVGANVGQGVEDVKQKVTKYFQMKPVINRPANLPGLFRKK